MNAKERFQAVMNFEPCDRTLDWEFSYWAGVVKRWYDEGLPKKTGIPEHLQHADLVHGPGLYWPANMGGGGVAAASPMDKDIANYFNFDKGIRRIPLNIWMYPDMETRTVAEDERTITMIDSWGITMKVNKVTTSPPEYIDWPIKKRKDWEEFKERYFKFSIEDRLPQNWPELVKEFKNREYPLMFGGYPCGYYGALRHLMGDVGLSLMIYDDPELVKDIQNFLTELWIKLYDIVLKDIVPDWCLLWEDMAYNSDSMISPASFREFLMPYYKRLTSFLKSKGVKNILVDSDGNCWKLIPLWIESGVTGQYPIEVTAGMDIVKIRKDFPKYRLMGGLDKKEIAKGKTAIDKVLSIVPDMIKQGGYVPFLDHTTHEDISWENFKYYREQLTKIIYSTKVLS